MSFPWEDKELTFTFAMILLVVIGMSVWFYDADQLNQAYYEKHRKLQLDAPYGPNQYWYPEEKHPQETQEIVYI